MTAVFGGVDWTAVQLGMWTWVRDGCGLPDAKVNWGGQDASRAVSPAIEMRVSNVNEIGRMWNETIANPLVITTKTVTAVDVAANTLASIAHGMLTGDGPFFLSSTGTFPTAAGGNLAASTNYWAIAPDVDHVQLARTYGATGGGQGSGNPTTPIDLTSTGTGTLTINSTPDSLRAGQELTQLSRGYLRVSLELRAHSVDSTGNAMAVALLESIRAREPLSSQCDTLANVNIAFIEMERARAIMGVRDAALFEPRSITEVHFCVPVQVESSMTIISQAVMQFLTTGQTFTVPPVI